MQLLEVCLLLLGVLAMLVGYHKHMRNVLVLGGLLMFSSAIVEDFVNGFADGYRAEAQQSQVSARS